jgi:peptidyl-prolyl cis-trans isomerase SurA
VTLFAPLLALTTAAGATAGAAAPATPDPGVTTASATAAPAPGLRSTIDRVAATVNGDVITLRELERMGGSALAESNVLAPGPDRDRARAKALRAAFDLMVANKLFEQQVKKLDLQVSDAQVDAQIEAIKSQNGFDDPQLDRALMAQGLTRQEFRDRIRNQLENFAVLQYKVGGRVKVNDQELENYYRSHPQEFEGEDEIHVRHIFLPLAENAPAAEVKRVQDEGNRVLQRLRSGEDFAKVAKEVSRGPSAEAGGDLGWLKRGTIQRQLEDAAFSLKEGQFSGLIRAGNGVHILRVDEHRKASGRTFAEVKETIRDRLVNEQADKYREQYVAELRRDALIEMRIPELKEP